MAALTLIYMSTDSRLYHLGGTLDIYMENLCSVPSEIFYGIC